jgi:SM-20-related protein
VSEPGQQGPQDTVPRTISVRLQLENGDSLELSLREDSPELATLFKILASRGNDALEPSEQFLQLPLDHGRAACSFHSRQLVSVITEPPVLVQVEQPVESNRPPPAPVPPVVVHTPRSIVIDDFLSPDEHRDMLAYAQGNADRFEAGTVVGKHSPHRQNMVIMKFSESAHSRLLCNRLLTLMPLFTRKLGLPLFPVKMMESQLTASNDGHFYRRHCDAGEDSGYRRALTCVYYFFREPRGFNGGALRLYDSVEQGGRRAASNSYREIEPVSNRLVVFPSTAFHELMRIRCPSRLVQDSRFAVTNWVHVSAEPLPGETFGWGHLHCGVVPAQLQVPGGASS